MASSSDDAARKQAQAIELIRESYNEVVKIDAAKEQKKREKQMNSASGDTGTNGKKKSGGYFGGMGSMFGKKNSAIKAATGAATAGTSETAESQENQMMDNMRDLDEMVRFNADITGANQALINIYLRHFRGIVEDLLNLGELQEQADFIALQIRKELPNARIQEFRACLLAAMSSTIPKVWNSKYEEAWSWLCLSLETQITASMACAKQHEQVVKKFVQGLTEDEHKIIGNEVFREGVFKKLPEAELRLKQSMQRFILVSKTALQYCVEIFDDPVRMKDQLENVGQKHILYQVEAAWFKTFVKEMGKVVKQHSGDGAEAGVKWCLSIMASLMSRIVLLLSTSLLQAGLQNDAKGVNKALSAQPRGTRADSILQAVDNAVTA